MFITELVINTPITVPFVSTSNTTGLTSFPTTYLLKNGSLTTFSPVYGEVGGGLYTATFTLSSTGVYTLFIQGNIQAQINVVAKSLYTFLQNLEDEAIGSWVWDKTNGTLLFTKQDGTDLAGFDVIDDLTTASRQRTTP